MRTGGRAIAALPDRTRAIIEAGLDPGSGLVRRGEVDNVALTALTTGKCTWPVASPRRFSSPARRPVLVRLRAKRRLIPVVAAMPVSGGPAALVGAATAGLGNNAW